MINNILTNLNKTDKEIGEKLTRFEKAENANKHLVGLLGIKANSILNKSLDLNSGRMIASSGKASGISSSAANPAKYVFESLGSLTKSKDEVFADFKNIGYNWIEYIGNEFNNFFIESSGLYNNLSQKKR